MIKIIPYEELGHADYGWLNAHYHFSFANYYNPQRTGFGSLLVVNDDIVGAGAGFDPHPHRDMEIITYVRSGAISHKDSEGHAGITRAGDVQVMSAGSGIRHAEYNDGDTPATLYQIWIAPRTRGIAPRWDSLTFPKAANDGALKLLVSGYPEDANRDGILKIEADAALYGGRLKPGATLSHRLRGQAYLLVSDGEIVIGGKTMKKGDGAEITALDTLTLTASSEVELVLIDLPAADQ
jgi:redox-sensitive bicupin YhaK (pirin superfamily)